MELRLEPELAAKVEQWSAETSRPASELVEDAIKGHFSEVEQVKETLDRRFDDIVSGRVKGIPGDVAIRMLRESAAKRRGARGGVAADDPTARG
jgi:predicted transcriptional regulator